MGDGNLKLPDEILRIYTNSFSKEEVELLASAIYNKLNIQTRVSHDRNNQYMITISKSQLPFMRELLKVHMHHSMYYKLGLELRDSEISNYKDIFEKLKQFDPDCEDYRDTLNLK
jgi:hypothetical protein